MTLAIKSIEEQIREKATEWGESMIVALRAHRIETVAQLEKRAARQTVLRVEEEMSVLKLETMRFNIHTALAKPVKHENIPLQ